MLTTKCIHPELIHQLALLGHGDKILIADGNYPINSKTCSANKIWLGLCKDVPRVTCVLDTILNTIHIEKAEVMTPGTSTKPEVFAEFSDLLDGLELSELERYPFYDACSTPDVKLAISTGESRVFANILITIGVA